MFGMEKGKKEKSKKKELFFELEKEVVNNPANYRKLKEKMQGRIQQLKTVLRSGADKDNFDNYGTLLHGYVSLQKVLARVHKKTR